jgi:hypothetical protein
MKRTLKIFLLCAALLAPGCFFDSDPVFLPDSDTTQEVVQDSENVLETPLDEPEGTADEEEEEVQPDLPGEPDSFDVRPEDVAPPDFSIDDLPVDLSDIIPGACVNAADQDIIDTVNIVQHAANCIVSCMSDVACLTDCISDDTGLSEACSACFAEGTLCIYSNCLSQCLSDPESAACLECREESGCNEAFEACSGLTDF